MQLHSVGRHSQDFVFAGQFKILLLFVNVIIFLNCSQNMRKILKVKTL